MHKGLLTFLIGFTLTTAIVAEEPTIKSNGPKSMPKKNLKMRTLGGMQFWTDIHFFHGWHIQQHAVTGHFRLLDERNIRHAWGTKEECFAALEKIRREQKLTTMSGRAVILVHGIGRSAYSLRTVANRFHQEDFTVIGFNYASTRLTIPEAAAALRQVIDSAEGITQIDFVAFSMGGLVVRSYLVDHKDPRLGRLVMLGVPNLGAQLAADLRGNWLFQKIAGPAGQQLARDPEGFVANLPAPELEFAVIAGNRGKAEGYNPFLIGDDDGTVSVESTRLPGAADFMTVRRLHSFIPSSPEVIESTHRFLTQGRLREEGGLQPIPRTVTAEHSNPAQSAATLTE